MQFRALNETCAAGFTVPSNAVDMHIKVASGSFFKVLLVLLQNGINGITSDEISEKTGIPADEVDEAARYWIRCKILPEDVIQGEKAIKEKHFSPQNVSLTAKEISNIIKTKESIAYMFSKAESLFGRPVTATEQKVLISMHEYLGLSPDIILMLIEYCLSIGKKSIRYMHKMAEGWADSGIVTHELAEHKIKTLKEHDELEGRIKAALGIYGRNLTASEKNYIKKWTETFTLSIDMIKAAYEITVNNTGKISFAYMDKILSSWSEKGFKTPEQALQERKAFKDSKKSRINFENDSFDSSKFEEMGIFEIPDVK